ncbi:dna-directed rna alpha subunit [Cystoisospora suis]|uniref:Dna-directed rna alpha subunit n=1 Tax=Cystoisospora suis TaxID=483139 RepID=A0A2C6KV52_9APIC|nr:dna-directed rna alpha subunit [Cystoisospora suis]
MQERQLGPPFLFLLFLPSLRPSFWRPLIFWSNVSPLLSPDHDSVFHSDSYPCYLSLVLLFLSSATHRRICKRQATPVTRVSPHLSWAFLSLFLLAACVVTLRKDGSTEKETSVFSRRLLSFPSFLYGAGVRVASYQPVSLAHSSSSSFTLGTFVPSTHSSLFPTLVPDRGDSCHVRSKLSGRVEDSDLSLRPTCFLPAFPSSPAFSYGHSAGTDRRQRSVVSSHFASAVPERPRRLLTSLLEFGVFPSISSRFLRPAPFSVYPASFQSVRTQQAAKQDVESPHGAPSFRTTFLLHTSRQFKYPNAMPPRRVPASSRAVTEREQANSPLRSSDLSRPFSSSNLPDWEADLLAESHFSRANRTVVTEDADLHDLEPTTLYDRGPKTPHVEMHPRELTGAPQSVLSDKERDYFWRHGYFRANSLNETDTWKNWHLLNRGQWQDPGIELIPNITTLRGTEEPPFHRVPLEHWDEARGLSYDLRHYPVYEELFNSTTLDPAIHTPRFNISLPMTFRPSFVPRRDRMGLLYGDARIFDTWPSWHKDFTLRVEEATNVTIIPETGHLYQKFYIGPIPLTTGWTMGSLIKSFGSQRCPGHAVVAIKLHAPPSGDKRKRTKKGFDKASHQPAGRGESGEGGLVQSGMVTQVPRVREDLLEIALNLKGVAFRTLVPRESACVRVKVFGPRLLVAGMINWPPFVQVANPEHFIARVEEGGVLDLEIKVEWGRGCWLADLHGLYREEEGVDSRCFKRRRIWEVDHRDFYPTSCLFGACTMMRIAVHKLMGTRFCQDRQVSTNPTEQLVLEVWSDSSVTPKQIIAFALQDMIAWFVDLRRQLVEDVDWQTEDEDLKASWENIQAWHDARQQQERLGGPPLLVWEDLNKNMTLAEGEKSFAMPELRPPPSPVHPVAWLKRELRRQPYARDGYSEAPPPPSRARKKSSVTARASLDSQQGGNTQQGPCQRRRKDTVVKEEKAASDEETDISKSHEERTDAAGSGPDGEADNSMSLLSAIPGLAHKAHTALEQSGISTLGHLRCHTRKELLGIPNVGPATVNHLASALERFNITLAAG